MAEVDPLVALAEVAGVFAGFGALISVRSGGASDAGEVVCIRTVLIAGLWVIVAGLLPATLGAYDIAGHELWFVCALVWLALLAVVRVMNLRTPEMRALMTSGWSRTTRGLREMVGDTVLEVPMVAALLLVVLDVFPDQEAALYLSAVVLAPFLAGLTLLWLVFAQPGPKTTSGETELPAA